MLLTEPVPHPNAVVFPESRFVMVVKSSSKRVIPGKGDKRAVDSDDSPRASGLLGAAKGNNAKKLKITINRVNREGIAHSPSQRGSHSIC